MLLVYLKLFVLDDGINVVKQINYMFSWLTMSYQITAKFITYQVLLDRIVIAL